MDRSNLSSTFRQTMAAMAGIIVGAIFAFTLQASTYQYAQATSYTSNVMPGLSVGDVCYRWYQFSGWHQCWHDDESGTRTALDSNAANGSDGNKPVSWKQWGSDWSNVVNVSFANVTGTNCTGVKVVITTSGATGDFNYKHIVPASGVIGSSWQNWFSVPGYVEGSRNLGATDTSQPTGCDFTGSHLHQSGDTAATTSIYTNKFAAQTGCSGVFCSWSLGTWVHQIKW